MPVLTDVVLKLMGSLFQRGYNGTCDNYFTSLGLALKNAGRKGNCMQPKCLGMMAKRQSHSHPTSVKQQKRSSFEQLSPGYPCFKRRKPKKET